MNLQQLTEEEMLVLGDEVKCALRYRRGAAIVATYFDPRAVGFRIIATGEYNDENYAQEGRFEVFDSDGNEVHLDFTRPFFQVHRVPTEQIEQYQEWDFDLDEIKGELGELGRFIQSAMNEAMILDFDQQGDSEDDLEHFEQEYRLDDPIPMPVVYRAI